MGWFSNSPTEQEECRGIRDEDISYISDMKLIMIALARLYEGEGIEDQTLIDELYRRGRT